jgi:carbon storage regulator
MLVLDRKINQSIMIGNIEVVITDIKGDHAKLGINAPRFVPVHRKEVYDLIQTQNIKAAESEAIDIDKIKDVLSF